MGQKSKRVLTHLRGFRLWDQGRKLRFSYILFLFINFLAIFLALRLPILDKNISKISVFIMNAKIRIANKFKNDRVVVLTIVEGFYLDFYK